MTADSDPPLEALAMQSSSAAAGTTTNNQEQHLREQVQLLKSPDSSSSSSTDSRAREQRSSYLSPPPTLAANGYDELASASHDANRAITSKAEAEAFIHPDLRAAPSHHNTANMMPIAPPSGHSPGSTAGASAAIAPAPPLHPGGDDPSGDGRKAKRELSQSKRAAQNRAAQRAFRQRKESYIKQLEQEVREYREMEKSHKTTQAENYALREYVITLQSRLLDSNGEFPQPPPNINLNASHGAPEPQMSAHEVPPSNNLNSGTQLEAVAQAVAGLAAQEQMNDSRHQTYPSPQHKHEPGAQDTRTAEEINRHLQSGEAGPEQSSNV